jgi:hypothetical protein
VKDLVIVLNNLGGNFMKQNENILSTATVKLLTMKELHYLMRMEDGWCCGAEGEHIVEGKNQQDIIKSMSNIKVCHCSKCRHWLSRWVDLSWKIGKAD